MASAKDRRVYSSEDHGPFCPECTSISIYEDPVRGEYVCRDCGVVYQDRTMKSEERPAFTADDKKGRSQNGGPIDPFGTIIPRGKVKAETPYTTYRNYRIRKHQSRAPLEVKQEAIGHNEIKRLASQLYLPRNPVEFADTVFKKLHHDHLLKGRSVNAMAAASLYYACRLNKTPLIIEDLIGYTRCFPKEIEQGYRLLARTYWDRYGPPPQVDPRAYISKFVSQAVRTRYADCNKEEQESIITDLVHRSKHVVSEQMHKSKYQGKDPKGIAAAGIYLGATASLHPLSQKEVAHASQITEVTLRERVRDFRGKDLPRPADRLEKEFGGTTNHYKPEGRRKSWLLRGKKRA